MNHAPPPPRGRYDRNKTAAQREAEHLDRLVTAAAGAARATGRNRVTVADLVKRARVGRNTFYAHFSGLEPAFERAEDAALEVLWRRTSEALAPAYTPIEKLRAIVRGWFSALDADPALMQVLIDAPSRPAGHAPRRGGSALRQLLRAALSDARRAAVLTMPVDDLRLLAATAIMEAFARRYLERAEPRDELETMTVDLVLRVFR
jgi:AcrR family transcriptional regulator